MRDINVSIIIVTYNTCEMTLECVDSIVSHTYDISYEIIVVDNASTDNSEEVLSSDNRLKYIKNKNNIGFGRANNIGIDIAKGRNVLFLNSDTLLINNAIKILSDYLDTYKDVGAVGGNLYSITLEPILSYQLLRPSIMWEINNLLFNVPLCVIYGKTNTFFNTHKHPINVGYIMGADLMVKKSILDKIGGFDSQFFMYFEETDMCNAIAKERYKIHCVPEAKIIHLEGKSMSQKNMNEKSINLKRIILFESSRIIYYKKNYNKLIFKIITLIYNLSLFIHPITFKILGKTQKMDQIKYKREVIKNLMKNQ